jgi:ATP-dependent HslUV protease ATP-binding subunit HslU
MERLLESLSYDASDRAGSVIRIDSEYVDSHLGKLAQDEDLSRFIL